MKDTEDDPTDHRGANHHTKACESGEMRRTFGIGKNMLGAVRRGMYMGAGLAGVDLTGCAGGGGGGGGGGGSVGGARTISSSRGEGSAIG